MPTLIRGPGSVTCSGSLPWTVSSGPAAHGRHPLHCQGTHEAVAVYINGQFPQEPPWWENLHCWPWGPACFRCGVSCRIRGGVSSEEKPPRWEPTKTQGRRSQAQATGCPGLSPGGAWGKSSHTDWPAAVHIHVPAGPTVHGCRTFALGVRHHPRPFVLLVC